MAVNVLELFAKLMMDGSEFEEGLERSRRQAEKFSANIKKVMSAVGKVTLAGLGAAATGVGAMIKQATSSYGEYEQLVGGVETLFKDNAEEVVKNSQIAYQSAQMSANEYMNTVTSFSASLLQGLGGDTKKAAEIADKAIIDMADNANKMGTAIGNIQNAYGGFAKQNYVMLDNLKLGKHHCRAA